MIEKDLKENLPNNIISEEELYDNITKDTIESLLETGVNRFLDCDQYLEDIEKQYNKSKIIINKYARNYKNEKDIKKYLKDSDKKICNVFDIKYKSIVDLMNIVETILCDSYNVKLFEKELPDYETWYQFEMQDMVFVNSFVNSIKEYKREVIDIEIIFYELNYAMKEYIDCIQDGYDYTELFDSEDNFVNICCKEVPEEELK